MIGPKEECSPRRNHLLDPFQSSRLLFDISVGRRDRVDGFASCNILSRRIAVLQLDAEYFRQIMAKLGSHFLSHDQTELA